MTGDGGQASSVLIQAGKSMGRGGGVLIQGGAGSTSGTYYGGDGGDVHLVGGKSAGSHLLNDRAGNIFLEGGESNGQGMEEVSSFNLEAVHSVEFSSYRL
jgi:hypothetical protein